MSEEVVFVFGDILGVGVLAYLLLGGGGLFSVKLSAAQIAVYAMQAGFTGDDLVTAVAIALAESGGDPNAQGDFMAGQYTSYGLWQIHWTVHPEFQPTQLFDPQYNANAAFLLYERRHGFGDWSTFNSGAYTAHLSAATEGVNA
jgi:Lysozyme like domain